jgi:hypothetical protein
MYNALCPIDRSELVFLACKSAWQGMFDAACYYCPRCDAGFVCWANPAYKKPVVFTWRRKGGDLILDTADASKVSDYLKHGWEVAQSDMLHRVRQFLQWRFSPAQACPNDGGRIPKIAELPCHEGSTIRYFWCRSCGELFAYLRDEYYGWQFIVSFSYSEADGYHLRNTFRNSQFIGLIQEGAASLPPPSAFFP